MTRRCAAFDRWARWRIAFDHVRVMLAPPRPQPAAWLVAWAAVVAGLAKHAALVGG